MHNSILMACIIQCRTLVIYQDTNIKLLKMNDFAKIFLSSMLNVLVYFLFNIIDVERDTHISYFINYLIDRPYSEETDSNLVISFTQSSCFSKFWLYLCDQSSNITNKQSHIQYNIRILLFWKGKKCWF